jgi:hypothetical protein
MNKNPRRRWLRFSVRTLILFTAIVAGLLGWFAWNRHVVRERQALLKHPWNQVAYWYLGDSSHADYSGHTDEIVRAARSSGHISANAESIPATKGNRLSWLRRLLGDRPCFLIKTSDPQLIPQLIKWFPEATCILDQQLPQNSNPGAGAARPLEEAHVSAYNRWIRD